MCTTAKAIRCSRTPVTDKGVLEYNMPAGAQVADAAHGVSSPSATHAATNFDYSFDTGTAGGTPQTIQNFLASGGQFIFKSTLTRRRRTIR